MTSRREVVRFAAGTAAILAITFGVNWPALLYPYCQEDWEVIGAIDGYPVFSGIRYAFSLFRAIHYRPLVTAYLIVLHRWFGLDGLPSHLLVMLMLGLSSLVLGALVRRLTGDARLGWLVAITNAAANVVHIDTLMIQTCGVENQFGSICFYGGTLLFLSRRAVPSALLYLAGMLVKEPVIILPGFLALAAAYAGEEATPALRLRSAARRMWPHAIVIAGYLLFKTRGLSPFHLPPTAPYYMSFFGLHLFTNFATYLGWTLEVLLPGVSRPVAWAVVGVVSALGLLSLVRVGAEGRREAARLGALYLLWYGFTLGPMLVLPNHTYRYYLVFSLPAAIAAWWSVLRHVFGVVVKERRELVALFSALALAGVHAWSFRARERGRIDLDGANSTLERATIVKRVWPILSENAPRLPKDTTLLFDNIEVWAFGKDAGPRLWCNAPTISAYSARDFSWPPGERPQIVNAARHQGELYTGAHNLTYLDPDKTFVVRDVNDEYFMESLQSYVEGL